MLGVVVACLLRASEARAASEAADLEKARAAYIGKSYEDAEARLKALLDPENPRIKDPVLMAQARMYLGATQVQQKRVDEAAATFEALLLADPQFDPDPLTFSGPVLEVFYDTRQRLREKLAARAAEEARKAAERRAREEEERRRQAARVRRLTELASEEYRIVENSRLLATVPFGVGQFQNRAPALGWFFLGAEIVLGASAALMVPLRVNADDNANSEYQRGNVRTANDFKDRAEAFTYANWALAGAFVLTAAAGVVQAHIAYVPEWRERKSRPLPSLDALRSPAPVPASARARVGFDTLRPLVSVDMRGGVVGLGGQF